MGDAPSSWAAHSIARRSHLGCRAVPLIEPRNLFIQLCQLSLDMHSEDHCLSTDLSDGICEIHAFLQSLVGSFSIGLGQNQTTTRSVGIVGPAQSLFMPAGLSVGTDRTLGLKAIPGLSTSNRVRIGSHAVKDAQSVACSSTTETVSTGCGDLKGS